MQTKNNCGKLVVKDGWYVCPNCQQRSHQYIRPDTVAQNLELWCRNCKAVYLVNIERGQCFLVSRSR